MSQLGQTNGYVLHEETESLHTENRCTRLRRGLTKCFGILYDYSIGSCITSLSCTQYFQCDKPQRVRDGEMNTFSQSGSLAGFQKSSAIPAESPAQQTIRRRDKFLKEEINLHFENHLQKWKRKRFPFKIVLYLLLVVLVTVQVSPENKYTYRYIQEQ